MFNSIEIGLFLDIEINLAQRGRFMSFQHRSFHLVSRWLWIGTGKRGHFIEVAHLWLSGNFKLLLSRSVLVIFESALQDLFFRVAFAMRSEILPEPEVVIEGKSAI